MDTTYQLKNLCSLFLYYMMYTKKVSTHTLKAYKADLKELCHLKPDSDLEIRSTYKLPNVKIQNPKKLEQMLKITIEQTIHQWTTLAASSKSRKLATIRSFIKWLSENKYIANDFRHIFKSPKIPIKIPNFLSVDEVLYLKNLLQKQKTKTANRDRALFFLLYGAGLRVSEACYLQTQNIDWNNHIIKIKGKGNKERLVAMPAETTQQLKPLKFNSPYIFGTHPLSERKAYHIIRSLGKKANLLKPLHPHALRHSFATHLLSGGSDLRVLQELLGHKTLTATQKYIHLDLSQLSQTLEKFHPIYQKES